MLKEIVSLIFAPVPIYFLCQLIFFLRTSLIFWLSPDYPLMQAQSRKPRLDTATSTTDKLRAIGGRNTSPDLVDFYSDIHPKLRVGQSHGLMASQYRGPKKYLVCFYCNKKSKIRFDGIIKQWDCPQCEATNFLDENGEITDPPVATQAELNPSHRYAAPARPDSPPAYTFSDQPLESEIFCSRCLKNQHLLTSSIAQYEADFEWGCHGPENGRRQKEYGTYLRSLEQRYPQVCEDCEPRVQERMRLAGKLAQSDFIGRAMEKSRQRGNQRKPLSIGSYFQFVGRQLWYAGLLGQLIWSVMTFIAYILHTSPRILEYLPDSTLDIFRTVTATTTSNRWANMSLFSSIASFWWNPFLSEMNRGFTRHITGTAQWYRFQALMIVSRSIFCFISGNGVLSDPLSQENIGLHGFMLLFIITLAIKTRRSLKMETYRLWADSPSKFRHVAPGRGSSGPATDPLQAALDEIVDAPLSGQQTMPDSPTPQSSYSITQRDHSNGLSTPGLPFKNTSRPQDSSSRTLYNSSTLGTFAQTYKIPRSSTLELPPRTTPSMSLMTQDEGVHYLSTGEIPSHLPQTYSAPEEAMEWTPEPPQPKHRAFKILPPLERNTSLFNQTPTTDNGSPFWYKVPPAPISPAHLLRNPPNQPRLRVTSQEVKDNFFNSVTRRDSGSDESGSTINLPNGKPRYDIELRQQQFFPLSPPTETDTGLTDLFTSFSLGTSKNETSTTPNNTMHSTSTMHNISNTTRTTHICQALVLGFGLYLWNYAFSHQADYSNSLMLGIMIGCVLISARTVFDNTLLAKKEESDALAIGLRVILGIFEFAMAVIRIIEIVNGRGNCINCASLGNITLGMLLLQELCML